MSSRSVPVVARFPCRAGPRRFADWPAPEPRSILPPRQGLDGHVPRRRAGRRRPTRPRRPATPHTWGIIMGQRTWRVLGISAAACMTAAACAVAEYATDADDRPEDARTEVAGCDALVCLRTCVELGLASGSCFEGECLCVSGDGPPADVSGDAPEPEDFSGDAPPPACDPGTCDSACRSVGYPGGSCDAGLCRCTSSTDAHADGPVDDGAVDDGAPDETLVDDGAVDDGAADDSGGLYLIENHFQALKW